MRLLKVTFTGRDLVLVAPCEDWPPDPTLGDVTSDCALELLFRAARATMPESSPKPQIGTHSPSVVFPLPALTPEIARTILEEFQHLLQHEVRHRAAVADAFGDPRPHAAQADDPTPAAPTRGNDEEALRIREEVDSMVRRFRDHGGQASTP